MERGDAPDRATTSGRDGDGDGDGVGDLGGFASGLQLLQAAERIQGEDSQGDDPTNVDREAILVEFDESVLEKIKEETQCMICFQVIKNCRTVKQCLHRFCHECIEMALRVNSKECPLCKTKLPSRRSLREDLNFDLLIKAIYGDPDEHRAEQLRTSDEWWSKNKGSFKHIGESYNKQKQATKGKRARTFPTTKRQQPTPKVPKLKEATRGRGRPPKTFHRQSSYAPTDPTPAEVEASYAYIRSENKRESKKILDHVKQENARRPESRILFEQDILVFLQPALGSPQVEDGEEGMEKLTKPFLLCNPNLHFGQLKKLVSFNLKHENPAELHFGLDCGNAVVQIENEVCLAEAYMRHSTFFKGKRGLSVQYGRKPFGTS